GKSYEGDAEKLKAQLEGFFTSKEGPPIKSSENKGKRIKGIVAPHYDLREAGPVYAWAYKELQEAEAPDVFIILGTGHSNLANMFAVTDKDFETPLGIVRADGDVLARFKQRGGTPFFQEDVRHQNEHTIEYQLPFLQYTVGRVKPITIVPVLCAFPPTCLADPQLAHMREMVETFLGALKRSLAESGKEACVVASAELAHIGMRYGDASPPTDFSFHRCMQSDLAMLKHVEELDADAFTQFILKEDDSRRVFGFASIYTLLRLIEAEKGQVLRYDRGITDQFNSTVTFASMAFF
ncbi:MAG: AmmeMemoRadiSam system protein B, partial [Nitrospiraceae bacterium]